MKFPEGDLSTAPKTIYWIGLPNTITRDMEIDMLKRDILIIPWNPHFAEFYQLTKTIHPRTVYFFNIDRITEENNITTKDRARFHERFVSYVREYFPRQSLVYGNKEPDESALYDETGIPYHHPGFADHLSKNDNCSSTEVEYHLYKNDNCSSTGVEHPSSLFSSIVSLTNEIIAQNPVDSEAPRSSFRLLLLPLSYTMEMIIPGGKDRGTIKGYIKDMSLGSVGCIFDNPGDIRAIKKKSRVNIRLFLHKTIVAIHDAVVSRVNTSAGEIGCSYDINDHDKINEQDSDTLTSLMYTWLNQVMYRYVHEFTGSGYK